MIREFLLNAIYGFFGPIYIFTFLDVQGKGGIFRVQEKRIIGGYEAEPGAWPWIVSIQHKTYKRNFCGGTILTDTWVRQKFPERSD